MVFPPIPLFNPSTNPAKFLSIPACKFWPETIDYHAGSIKIAHATRSLARFFYPCLESQEGFTNVRKLTREHRYLCVASVWTTRALCVHRGVRPDLVGTHSLTPRQTGVRGT